MKITIEDSLHVLKKYLEVRGYDAYFEKDNVPSDVYIYDSSNYKDMLTNKQSINDIEYIINHRTYSSLF